MAECQVCAEKFTKVIRREIMCMHCKGEICLKCFCTYLLTDGTKQVCMLCDKEINIEFIYLHTPKTFRESYKVKLINLEVIREKGKIDSTRQIEDAKRTIDRCRSRRAALHKHYRAYPEDQEVAEFFGRTREEEVEASMIAELPEHEVATITKSFHCPRPECNGMVSRGKCGACQSKVCCKCRELKASVHECNEDIIKTLKAMESNVKPCPKCKIPIYKIDGCDQMFCVECKTAFSWRKGTIETRIIHNPHYFQWMRETGGVLERQPGDDPCGERFTRALNILLPRRGQCLFTMRNQWCAELVENSFLRRTLGEVEDCLDRLNTRLFDGQYDQEHKRKLRLKYIKELDAGSAKAEQLWFNGLKTRFSKVEREKDILSILEMYKHAMQNMVVESVETNNFLALEEGLKGLINHVNDQFTEIKSRHNTKGKYNLDDKTGFSLYNLV